MHTSEGVRVSGWLAKDGKTNLGVVAPGDVLTISVSVLFLGLNLTDQVVSQLKMSGFRDDWHKLERATGWPWDNLWSVSEWQRPQEKCACYEQMVIDTPAPSLGYYWVEFARPEVLLSWQPVESTNNATTSITITLSVPAVGEHEQALWSPCYAISASAEGSMTGIGTFSGSPLTTVLTWHPEQREELGPRRVTGTLCLKMVGQNIPEEIRMWELPLRIKYSPGLSRVSRLPHTLTEVYSIPVAFLAGSAYPSVALCTQRTVTELEQINVKCDFGPDSGGRDLECPFPKYEGSDSLHCYTIPVTQTVTLSSACVAALRPDGRGFILEGYQYVFGSSGTNCGCSYNTIIFQWQDSDWIRGSRWQCKIPGECNQTPP